MAERGRLYVFEGPDGVGKTTIARAVVQRLEAQGMPCAYYAFPGREAGSLGHHVYVLHHEPARFGVSSISATSLQLLHIAAHIDAIERVLLPLLETGTHVILDRYWWSTWVYGMADIVDERVLEAMIEVERRYWATSKPAIGFLVVRSAPMNRDNENVERWRELAAFYNQLAMQEAQCHPMHILENESTVDDVVSRVIGLIGDRLGSA